MSENHFAESLLNDLEETEDGYFQLENENSQAVLTVYPAGKKGKEVEFKEVYDRVRLFGISDYDKQLIRETVEARAAQPVVIGHWKTRQPEDASIIIEIADDKMTAWARITPPRHGGKTVTREQIDAVLKQNSVTHGIVEASLKELATDPHYNSRYVIARGRQPVAGTNARIEFLFETDLRPDLKEDESGRVDFREVNFIKSVAADDTIARKHQASKGEPGYRINGEQLPAEDGQDVEFKLGANTELSKDKKSVIAKITGRPVLDKFSEIRVDEIVRLDDVDYSTGNVDFPGTIIVENRIADGFKLATEGSIYVKETVGKVYLKAGADIILSNGFVGRGEGSIEAAGDIHARFVEQGMLRAGGSIFIYEACMHSKLIAAESIEITGRRGDLLGGEAIAGNYILCGKLGAVVETRTKVSAGIPPEVIETLKKLQTDIQEKNETLKKVQESLNKYSAIEENRTLTEDEKNTRNKLIAVDKKYSSLVEAAENQHEKLSTDYEARKNAYVGIKRELYPNVEIFLGKGKFYRSGIKGNKTRIFVFLDINNEVVTANHPPRLNEKNKPGSSETQKNKNESAPEITEKDSSD